MHEDSIGQTIIRWWHHFSSDLGSHVCAEQLFQCGKKCVYVEKYEGFSSEQLAFIPNGDLCCGSISIERSPHNSMWKWSVERGILHLTMIRHKRDLVMRSFSTLFVIELSDNDMRLCQKACALLLEWFLIVWSNEKVLFSDESAVYCSSLSWNVFLGQDGILVTHLRCKTTHHTWW